jgi:hypothetical protein|tara:strand:+ start:229 stop:720 length:492 start_codon:yes stop_codon:yes gene_type:complete
MSEKTCQDKCILCCERCAKSFSARFLKATYAKRRGLTYVLIALAVLGVITTFEGMRGSERDWTKYCSYAAFLLHAGAGVSAARGMQSLTPMPWMFFSTFAGFAAVLDILVYAFAVRIASVIALTLLLYAKLFCVSWTVFFGMRASLRFDISPSLRMDSLCSPH